jgi:hypothetical protein
MLNSQKKLKKTIKWLGAKNNETKINDLFTYKCWSSYVPGKILKAEFSNDKSILLINYQIIVENTIFYRLRYYNSVNCITDYQKIYSNYDNKIEQALSNVILEYFTYVILGTDQRNLPQ